MENVKQAETTVEEALEKTVLAVLGCVKNRASAGYLTHDDAELLRAVVGVVESGRNVIKLKS